MNTSTRVGICIAIGIALGAGLALELSFLPWWIAVLVGAILGCAVGCAAYAYREIRQAIPIAAKKATSWRPDTEWWKHYVKDILCVTSMYWSIFLLMSLLTVPDFKAKEEIILIVGQNTVFVILLYIAITGVLAFIAALFASLFTFRRIVEFENPKRFILRTNPFAVYVYWPICGFIWILRRSRRAPKVVASGSKVVGRFFKFLFIYTYSRELLLICIYVCAGVLVGYITVHPLICAAIFGGLGKASYELISVRWLNLVPSSS